MFCSIVGKLLPLKLVTTEPSSILRIQFECVVEEVKKKIANVVNIGSLRYNDMVDLCRSIGSRQMEKRGQQILGMEQQQAQ
jgi:hypothetical protein